MARPDSWMPIYWADYWADTGGLTAAQHGAYLNLLGRYWRTGFLPNDDEALQRLSTMTEKEWKSGREVVLGFFTVDGNRLAHKRIDAELKKANARYEAKAGAGAKGAANRWQHHKQTDGTANGTAMAKPMTNGCTTHNSHSTLVETDANASVARKTRKPRRTRLADDWKPSEADRAYARNLGLTDPEIDGVAIEFARYWRGGDAKGGGLKSDWAGTWANRVDDQAPRVIARRTGRTSSRGASVTAARDSILAKAGIRPEGRTDGVPADANNWPQGDRRSAFDSGTVIDADDWRETIGPVDGTEGANEAKSRVNGGLGSPDDRLPQAAGELPGRRCGLRPDDTARPEPMVAGLGGVDGAAGDADLPAQDDAGSFDADRDMPQFLRRAV